MTISQRLQNLATDKLALDEMVELAVSARQLRDGYEHFGATTPEWLNDALATLTRDIKARTADTLELRLKEIETAEEALRSTGEKRQRLAAEKEELLRKLGKQPVTA